MFKENIVRYAAKFIGTKILGERNDLNLDRTVKRAVEGLSAVQNEAKRYKQAVNLIEEQKAALVRGAKDFFPRDFSKHTKIRIFRR